KISIRNDSRLRRRLAAHIELRLRRYMALCLLGFDTLASYPDVAIRVHLKPVNFRSWSCHSVECSGQPSTAEASQFNAAGIRSGAPLQYRRLRRLIELNYHYRVLLFESETGLRPRPGRLGNPLSIYL